MLATETPARVPHLIVFAERWYIGWVAFLCAVVAAVFTAVPIWAWSDPLVTFKQGLVRFAGPLFGAAAWGGLALALKELWKPTPSLVVRDKGLEIGGSGLVPWNLVRGVRVTATETGVRYLEFDVRAPWLPSYARSLHLASLTPGPRVILHNLEQRGITVTLPRRNEDSRPRAKKRRAKRRPTRGA